MLSIAIAVVSYGSATWLPQCLSTLYANLATYPQTRVALVENKLEAQSLEATSQTVAPYLAKGLQLLVPNQNLGYGRAANWAWEQLGHADIQLVLNPDMSFPLGWLQKFIAPFETDPQIGVVGCKLLRKDNTIQHAGGLLCPGLALGLHFGVDQPDDGRWDDSCETDFVTGAALALRTGVIDGFDPAFFPGYYEDVDVCVRVQDAGFKVWYNGSATAYHYEGGAFGREQGYYEALYRSRLRFIFKHYSGEQILYEFLPAERARLQQGLAQPNQQAITKIYKEAANTLNKNDNNNTLQNLVEHAREVKSKWLVEEKPFRSAIPFVAQLRERFNSISTRWYVKPILSQQVEFNAAVTRTLEDLSKLALSADTANDLQTAVFANRLTALETRLTHIEQLLAQLNSSK